MDVRPWEIALSLVYVLVVSPPRYVYHTISSEYKRQARALKASIPLSMASELKRQAREEANRSHGFMRLPGEIRNRIYSLCMVSETIIDPIWGAIYCLKQIDETESCLDRSSVYREYITLLYPEHRYEPYQATWARMGNMSQVCRAWRIEAMKHFYGNNIFKLPIGKHLHERGKINHGRESTERRWYAIWPLWKPSYWHRSVVGPAGRFASRRFYTSWLQKRPKEAFAVMRLVLHDYRRCPHFVPQHNLQTLQGSCMVLLDFEKQALRAVRGMDQRDSFNLWNCDFCWKQFDANVTRLNRNKEIGKLLADFNGKMHADTTIRVVDGLRRILEAEYE